MWLKLLKGIFFSLLVMMMASLAGCDSDGSNSSGGGGNDDPGTDDPTKMETPQNLAATDGTYTDKIVVSWDKVTGAASYTLYKAEAADGEYAVASEITATDNPNYIEQEPEQNKHFYYKVKATPTDTTVLESDLSASDDGYARVGAATVQNLTASDGAEEATIGLKWDLIDGATSYKIYRSDTLDGTYSEIATIDPASIDPVDPVDPVDPPDPSTVTSQFTSDVNLSDGILVKYLYTYRIRLRVGTEIDELVEFKNFSIWNLFGKTFHQEDIIDAINSAAGSEICAAHDSGDSQYVTLTYNGEPIILQNDTTNAPINKFLKAGVGKDQVVVVNGNGTNIIEAADFTDNPADYITDDGSGDDGTGDDDGDDDGDTTNPEYYYVDSNVTKDIYYYYKVQAIDASGPGDLSDFDYGYCGGDNLKPVAPTGVAASDGSSASSITITWNPGIGAETYTVYRAKFQKTSTDGVYTITPGTYQEIASGITEETYTDTASESNVIDPGLYYYTVAAVNTNGTSNRSQNDTGYRTITDTEFVTVYRQTESRLLAKIQSELGNPPVGKVTVNGDISGSVAYSSTFSGTVGKVVVPYSNYCEFYETINGTSTTSVNVLSLPGNTTGTLTVTGIYPGTVELHLTVNTSGVNGGSYTVTQQGQTSSEVQWTK